MTTLRLSKLLVLGFLFSVSAQASGQELRAPAYPLITHNPNFSIWSMGDKLNGSATKHWTGEDHSLVGLVKVDGEVYRFLGKEPKQYKTVLPASDESNYAATYSLVTPASGWTRADFDDSKWKKGEAPFSDNASQAKTLWQSDNLWFRRSFTLKDIEGKKLFLKLRHDDNVKVYINGEKIYDFVGWVHKYKYIPVSDDVASRLTKGENVLAIHVANTAGGRWLDAGLVVEEPDKIFEVMVAEQTDVRLSATQTEYKFKCGKVDVTATFTSPLLMDDLEVLGRPVSYVAVRVSSNDNQEHDVQLYMGASGLIAVNTPGQELAAEKYKHNDLSILKVGTKEQPVLGRKGDDVRIDWGYFYLATPNSPAVKQYLSSSENAFVPFVSEGKIPEAKSSEGKKIMLNTVVEMKKIGKKGKEQIFLIGYDELYSVQYFEDRLKPWWKKKGDGKMESELEEAYSDYKRIIKKSSAFDEKLVADAESEGGKEYADLCVLAYRQAIAAHTLVESPDGDILFLSKENNSNGSINTVDVTYPSAPLFLMYNPDLLKGMLNGIFYYSESGRWKKPFPAHDLGTYPIATGQTYGEDMPVEEAGNMIILTAAIAAAEGKADYAKKHWKSLTQWAEYLSEHGFDPANQLSTDDFAGHLARNANLSVKAIMALASYGKVAGMLQKNNLEEKYTSLARNMAQKWAHIAEDGDHYVLAFGQPGTWSQKYNLVWDDILDLQIFPEEVRRKEVAFYLTQQNEYGLPLDNRRNYTKSDWVLWTATLAANQEDFQALIKPIWQYANDTPNRVPLSDWHETKTARVVNFKARSVVGGYFIKLLEAKFDKLKL